MVSGVTTSWVNRKVTYELEKKALTLSGKDLGRLTASLDRLFRKTEKKLFRSEGNSGGKAWPPLKDSTKARKKGFPGKLIMQRTQNLRDGLIAAKHPDHVARYTFTRARAVIKLGTRNQVAAYHGGAKRMKGRNRKLPIRSVLQFTNKQGMAYQSIVRTFLNKRIRETARRNRKVAKTKAGAV